MPDTFVIIGAGGTASHLIPVLVRMCHDDDLIHVWDGDTVEEVNLERQMFEPHEVGLPKATAWEKRYPRHVKAHTDYLGSDNVQRAIRDDDTVFICADNMTVRRTIAAHCETLKDVTLINGGNEMFTGSTQLYIRNADQNLTPNITYHSPEMQADDGDLATMSCAQIARLPGGGQTTVANMTVAAIMLHQYWQSIVRWLPHQLPDKAPTKVTFDLTQSLWQASDVRMHGDDWA